MDIRYSVDDIHTELGKQFMKAQALDKTCDQLQAEIQRLRKELEDAIKPPEVEPDGQ